jgi:hypothetical protein
MNAPKKFVAWMSANNQPDKFGNTYRYHPRSDSHSKAICEYMVLDLLEHCEVLKEQAASGAVAYGINLGYTSPVSGKRKAFDLAIGTPATPFMGGLEGIAKVTELNAVLLTCEAKSAMTEHVKAKPRLYDELSSSHEIVHQGRPEAIATGITVINRADTYYSPTNQRDPTNLTSQHHDQPRVTKALIDHLRGLTIRNDAESVGFDAYCNVVITTDNLGGVALWNVPPAPQPGEKDHYGTFIEKIARVYTERFSTLPK